MIALARCACMYVCVQVWESEWLVCDMQIWNNGTLNVYDASVVGLRSFFWVVVVGLAD